MNKLFKDLALFRIALAASCLIAALSIPELGIAAEGSTTAPITYSFTGSTATGDSAITAWFQFDSSAMWDGLVFFYEIPQHSFLITGDIASMNGEYDRFLGGGISFPSSTPSPQNLPTFQSLVIQNSSTRYYVQANGVGDPTIFLGGPSGAGTVYSGQWSFVPVPEPGIMGVMIVGAGALAVLRWRRNAACKSRRGFS